ncbi:hypothetical protein ACFLS9_08870 [Bacteroidota bacterium]
MVAENIISNKFIKKITVIVIIQLIIAAAHFFRIGRFFDGQLYILYYSYFSDLALPFGFYFLLCGNAQKVPFLRRWTNKAIIVFSAAATAEILQYFGIYALGITFDPVDILMYGIGVLFAAFVDTQIFPRIFKFWVIE